MNQPFLQASGILSNDSKGVADADNASAVSYTHLTLPTTPYV